MSRRLKLHEELINVLGSKQVYFQPPESLKLSYPAIVYERSGINTTDADNIKYLPKTQYQITVIDPSPDSEIVERVSKMQYIRFVRHFATQGLNHDVFTIYY